MTLEVALDPLPRQLEFWTLKSSTIDDMGPSPPETLVFDLGNFARPSPSDIQISPLGGSTRVVPFGMYVWLFTVPLLTLS